MDTNLVLRAASAGNLTGDETLTSVCIGPMTRPLWLNVYVPAVSAGDVLDVKLDFCATGATTTAISILSMKQITAAGYYSIPFYTAHEYLQVRLDETDNGGPNFGAVKVWISNAHRSDQPYNA